MGSRPFLLNKPEEEVYKLWRPKEENARRGNRPQTIDRRAQQRFGLIDEVFNLQAQ